MNPLRAASDFLRDVSQWGPKRALWNAWRKLDAEVSKRLVPFDSSHVVYTGPEWTWTLIENSPAELPVGK